MLRNLAAAVAYYLYNGFITHVPFYSIRHAYLRGILGFPIGRGTAVHMGCFFTGRRISIGADSVINRRCYLDGRAGLVIGDKVSVSPECYILSLTHDVNSPDFKAIPKPVEIKDYVWLGARCIILPGVTLGEGCVAAAGAVVSKPAEDYAIVAGVPARKIGDRQRGLNYAPRYFPLFDTDITL